MIKRISQKYYLIVLMIGLISNQVFAHHIIGRPSYGLTEDSTTPPHVQAEVQIDPFIINYMVYPAFPKPGQTGRINFYASNMNANRSYSGEVEFKLKSTGWFRSETIDLGRQKDSDHVFQLNFEIPPEGEYSIIANFEHQGKNYTLDFPLQVGPVAIIGPLGAIVSIVVLLIIIASLTHRKRLQRLRARRNSYERNPLAGVE